MTVPQITVTCIGHVPTGLGATAARAAPGKMCSLTVPVCYKSPDPTVAGLRFPFCL